MLNPNLALIFPQKLNKMRQNCKKHVGLLLKNVIKPQKLNYPPTFGYFLNFWGSMSNKFGFSIKKYSRMHNFKAGTASAELDAGYSMGNTLDNLRLTLPRLYSGQCVRLGIRMMLVRILVDLLALA